MPRIRANYSIPQWKIYSNDFIHQSLKERIERELAYSLSNEILHISKNFMIPTIHNDVAEFRLEGYWWNLEEGLKIQNKLVELNAYKQVFGADNELVKRYQLEQDIQNLIGK